MVAQQMHLCRAEASQKRNTSMQRIFATYKPYKGFCFFLLNFYFCDSTAVKSLKYLSHYFYTNTLLLLNRICKCSIRVSCVTESTDSGRQLIYTKQSFCYKSKKKKKTKKLFSWIQKGFLSLVSQQMMQNGGFHITSFQMQIVARISIN